MALRAALVLALWLGWGDAGVANETHGRALVRPPAWVCLLVRQEAQRFPTRAAAIRAAQERGYTAEEIARAKLCF